MEGTPEEGMNELRILAPDVEGELFIDHLIPASKVDARQQAADVQVPFVHKGTTNHWLVIYPHSLWIRFTFETGFRKRASGYAPDGKALPGFDLYTG